MKMSLLNMICSTNLWKIYLFNWLFPYFPIIKGSWTKHARHESSCSLTPDINVGLSVNGEAKIPMDYNVPHETEICGGNYTLISSTPVFPNCPPFPLFPDAITTGPLLPHHQGLFRTFRHRDQGHGEVQSHARFTSTVTESYHLSKQAFKHPETLIGKPNGYITHS